MSMSVSMTAANASCADVRPKEFAKFANFANFATDSRLLESVVCRQRSQARVLLAEENDKPSLHETRAPEKVVLQAGA